MISLGGKLCGSARLHVPLYGVSTAEVELLERATVSGRQTLVVGDLSLVGTIVDGGVVAGQGRYHWRSGAGRWAEIVPGKGYGNAQGVQRSVVIRELAEAVGETVAFGVPEARLGLAPEASYVRLGGPAWLALKALSVPWYVDAAGVTQIGERPSAAAPESQAMLVAWSREDGRRVYIPNAEGVAGWLPGNTIGGEQIVSLDVDAQPGKPLRMTVYSRAPGDISHDWRTQFDQIVEQDTAHHRFFGVYRYTVASRQGDLYGLVPVRADLGLPVIGGAAQDNAVGVGEFPGAAGHSADLPVGMVVGVGFMDGDPGEPFIVAFERLGARGRSIESGGGPINSRFNARDRLDLCGALQLVARETDPVGSGSISFRASLLVPGALAVIYTDGGGATQEWTIGATNGAGPITFSVLPAAVSKDLNGFIGTPGQSKVRA